jgi:glycosyltransferase involved in cell wall biosynthesis
LQKEKGVFDVIDAVIKINRESNKIIKLLIAGPEYENSSEIIKKYEKKYDYITCLGTISEREKILALHSSDLLVVPSIVDSFGIIYIEAWACKKPVIGADIPSTRSLISQGKDGFYVKFGDIGDLAEKIKYIIKHEGEKGIMGNNGFNKVKNNYTEDIVFNKVWDVYHEVLGD